MNMHMIVVTRSPHTATTRSLPLHQVATTLVIMTYVGVAICIIGGVNLICRLSFNGVRCACVQLHLLASSQKHRLLSVHTEAYSLKLYKLIARIDSSHAGCIYSTSSTTWHAWWSVYVGTVHAVSLVHPPTTYLDPYSTAMHNSFSNMSYITWQKSH